MPKTTYRVLSGLCPDEKCQTKLFFPSYDSSIECTSCGQRHEQTSLKDVQEVTDPNIALHNMIRNIFLGNGYLKKGTEMVKVLGLSNYHCKLLSQFLTRYGMDKKSGEARLLKDLNQGDVFNCSLLGNRCFLIDPEHIEVVGYGRDISGSVMYLADTLKAIKVYNNNQECLLPIHADGDGHCLVHAVSRALVGRELFWHPLRTNLKEHFSRNINKYRELFRDFIDDQEWRIIIEECDADFQPPEGELLGLRNIHVLGLANVLHRPIILLDSLKGMQSSGDYAATFLPALIETDNCRGNGKELNKPLCIAWSSSGRNHYIALVGIKKKSLPKLHRSLVPKAWGMPQGLLEKYIEFDENGFCIIGGDKCLQDSYVLRLSSAMEEVFIDKYHVSPSLVADVHHYIYKRTGVVGAKPETILESTYRAIQERRLYRCLTCDAICEQKFVPEWFKHGGALYSLAEQRHGKLKPEKLYSFPLQGVTCSYDAEKDELVPDGKETLIEKCTWCHGTHIRLTNGDGSVEYKNGDRTKTVAQTNYCNCGYKHFWDGKEYDNLPQVISLTMEWGGKKIKEKVAWFQLESDTSLNSNVYEVAGSLVQKYFPGMFGSERLVQKIVDQILEETKKPEVQQPQQPSTKNKNIPKETSPNKIIIMGHKTVHKEELNMSESERLVRQRIEANAPLHQRRQSLEKQAAENKNNNIGKCSDKTDSRNNSALSGSALNSNSTGGSNSVSPIHTPHSVIRVVTSDGRQIRVVLDSSLTYASFKKKLEIELGVPIDKQKIMYGFPKPMELLPTVDDEKLPFQSGDKVSLEILGQLEDKFCHEVKNVKFKKETTNQDGLLQRLQELQTTSMDNLDTAITSLLLTSTLSGQNLWEHVLNMPQLFSAGGLLYLQMQRDVGLSDGKHYRHPLFPEKLFRYNATQDQLELCLEPYGHFPVEPGIEEKVMGKENPHQTGSEQFKVKLATAKALLAGSSGVFVSKSQQVLTSHVPFQGQGYSLSSAPSTLVSDELLPEKDFESDEQMDTGQLTNSNATSGSNSLSENVPPFSYLLRRGPGYSVLNREVNEYHNSQVERLTSLTSQLQQCVEEVEKRENITEDVDEEMHESCS